MPSFVLLEQNTTLVYFLLLLLLIRDVGDHATNIKLHLENPLEPSEAIPLCRQDIMFGQGYKHFQPNPNSPTVSLDPGTKEAETTHCTYYLI